MSFIAFTSFVILINGPTCTVIGFAVSCKLYAHSNVIVPPGCTSANDGCASITSGIIVATLHCMEFLKSISTYRSKEMMRWHYLLFVKVICYYNCRITLKICCCFAVTISTSYLPLTVPLFSV